MVPGGQLPNWEFVLTLPPTEPPTTLMFEELWVRISPLTSTFQNVTSSVPW